jgi:adenosine deaminase
MFALARSTRGQFIAVRSCSTSRPAIFGLAIQSEYFRELTEARASPPTLEQLLGTKIRSSGLSGNKRR